MARYVNEFSVVNDMNGLYAAIEQYLRSEGYEYVRFENEDVFKKGKGVVSGPTFIKIFQNGNNIRIEAWLKFAVLPGVYAGEMDLNGAMGFAMKDVLKKRVQHVESIIMQFGGQPMMAQQGFVQAPQNYAQPQQGYVQQPQQNYAQQPNFEQPASAAAPAFCSQCGAKLAEGAAFCSACGNAVK